MTTRRFPKRPSLETMVERVDQQRPGDVPGDTVPTGFPSIDRILGGGLRRRDLVVLGGDIGSGKSDLSAWISSARATSRATPSRPGSPLSTGSWVGACDVATSWCWAATSGRASPI